MKRASKFKFEAKIGHWLTGILFLFFSCSALGQTQTLRGRVIDGSNQQPLIGATVKLLDTNPLKGGTTDENGRYVITDIPAGRYDVEFSYVGYSTRIENGVVISTGRETQLSVTLKENRFELEEVVVSSNQRAVLNEAALLSARTFRVEELGRIPGGIDDPARMARKFAGVSPNSSVLSNNINIRGNSSRAVLWRLEDVDVYNPNHFGVLGGNSGTISILSQRLLSNTDFYTGAFPADYGNSIGAIFDVRFRNGNMEKRSHSAQLSFLGIDFATEGPIGKKGNTSYLLNYRYSTTGILDAFFQLGAIPVFQDLSFKVHHITDRGGQWDLFGFGGISNISFDAVLDTAAWNDTPGANSGSRNSNVSGTVGTSYFHPMSDRTYAKFMVIGTGINIQQKRWFQNQDLLTADTTQKMSDYDARISLSGFINHKFSDRHTHRSGVMLHGLGSRVSFLQANDADAGMGSQSPFDTVRVGSGTSALVQAYTRSQFYVNPKWQLNAGVHFMYFPFTGEAVVEPRLGARWQINPAQTLTFGYGLHSQVEPFFAYISERPVNGVLVRQNDDLRFNKAHHINVAWYYNWTDKLRMGIEAYYQHQFDLVVGEDLPIARVAGIDFLFESFDLNNEGTGRNFGIEASLERSFSQGYYFLANASVFDATYVAADGVRRNSQFNAQYVANVVVGKEWVVGQRKGRNNLLSANLAGTYGGPQYFTPLDVPTSVAEGQFVFDYANPNSRRQDPLLFLDASVVYRVNKEKYNSEWTLQINNMLNAQPVVGELFDQVNGEADPIFGTGFFPLLSWRINF
ncbi:MAG: TonB-dependent receptor [Bacteroidota bacterium]